MPFVDFLKRLIPFRTLVEQQAPTVRAGGFAAFLSKLLPWKQTQEQGAGAPPSSPPPAATGNADDEWALSGTWLNVGSTNVHAIRYLWDAQTLEVQFKGTDKNGRGYFYNYFSVPPDVATGMARTDSPGRYVWRQLRDRFDYVRLTGFGGTSRTPTVIRPRRDLEGTPMPFANRPAWMR